MYVCGTISAFFDIHCDCNGGLCHTTMHVYGSASSAHMIQWHTYTQTHTMIHTAASFYFVCNVSFFKWKNRNDKKADLNSFSII